MVAISAHKFVPHPFAWLNDTIRADPGVMFNKQHRSLQSCLNLFHFGQYAKLFRQFITEHFILCTRIGTQNNAKKYGMHSLATQVLSSLDCVSILPPFCFIYITMWRWSHWYDLTARHFRLFVPIDSVLISPGSIEFVWTGQLLLDKDISITIVLFITSL